MKRYKDDDRTEGKPREFSSGIKQEPQEARNAPTPTPPPPCHPPRCHSYTQGHSLHSWLSMESNLAALGHLLRIPNSNKKAQAEFVSSHALSTREPATSTWRSMALPPSSAWTTCRLLVKFCPPQIDVFKS